MLNESAADEMLTNIADEARTKLFKETSSIEDIKAFVRSHSQNTEVPVSTQNHDVSAPSRV